MAEAKPQLDGAAALVAVVGGGLAGLTAALDLADAGVRTVLIEKRPYVGGKTYSFMDSTTGMELDNGQHVYLRCCTAYRALIERLGLHDSVRLQRRLRLPVLDPGTGRRSAMESWPPWLPAPLNLGWSILRSAHLTWPEKLRLGQAALPIRRMGSEGRRKLDGVSFGDWLRAHGQSDRVIERFWDLIVLPTCNDAADQVSAQQALMVFQVGLFQDAHGADIGMATAGLSHIAETALRQFQAAGGEARLGRGVEALTCDGDRGSGDRVRGDHVTGVRLAGGERIPADGVVLALPPNGAVLLLPERWRHRSGFKELSTFEFAPIVNVHVEWDRPVLAEEFVAVLDPAVQYVFNRSRILGREGQGQWLACSLSGAPPRGNATPGGHRRGGHRRAATRPARRARRQGAALARREGAGGDLSAAARHGLATPPAGHVGAEPPAGGRLDRYRVAGHDGVRGSQRARRGQGLAGARRRAGAP